MPLAPADAVVPRRLGQMNRWGGTRLVAIVAACIVTLGCLAGCSATPAAPATTAVPTVDTATRPTPVVTPSQAPSTSAPPPDERAGAALDQPYTVNGIIVVSKAHPISAKYAPDRTTPNGLTPATKQALNTMFAAAKADGVRLLVRSGYRSYAEQGAILAKKIKDYGDEELARRYNAAAGCSEHQTGLAADIWDGVTWGTGFAGTTAGKWLWEHAREYGFILRYPPDKEAITGYAYEPWHFRYVGVDISMQFPPNTSLTLEEFLGLA